MFKLQGLITGDHLAAELDADGAWRRLWCVSLDLRTVQHTQKLNPQDFNRPCALSFSARLTSKHDGMHIWWAVSFMQWHATRKRLVRMGWTSKREGCVHLAAIMVCTDLSSSNMGECRNAPCCRRCPLHTSCGSLMISLDEFETCLKAIILPGSGAHCQCIQGLGL